MEEKPKYKIIFEKDIINPSNKEEIVISRVPSNWNDFGYQIRCDFRLMLEKNDIYVDEMFIGFLPPHNISDKDKSEFFENHRSLEDVLPYLNTNQQNGKQYNIRFFTMLPNMDAYRKLVYHIGVNAVQDFLSSINDLVYYKNKGQVWVDEAITSEVFKFGFMRNSEPFFAFHNADSVLDGEEEETFSGISQKLILTYKLDGFENQHEIPLTYNINSYIPKRINILIGKNGLGKSQALKSFCRAALQYKDKNNSLLDVNSKARPMINRLLAIETPGENQDIFPIERKKSQKLFYRRLSLTRNSGRQSTRSISELLVQLARSDERLGMFSRWYLFYQSLSKVLPVDKIVFSCKDQIDITLKSFNRRGGEQSRLAFWAEIDPKLEPKICHSNKLYPLSSGQLTFFKFALLCCLYIENGSFVLLDEPETHMHPNMISDFVELLDTLLEATGSLALIATHSVYFVREVSREQVHALFENELGNITITTPRLRTFGADIESISQFVFDEDVNNRLTEKIFQKVKGMSFEEVKLELSDELSLAALLNLKNRMEAI